MTGQQLKNSILQMAVQGKLVPQDPNDEPASVLLERIRKEKERLVREKKIKPEKNPSVIFRGADNLPYEKRGKEVRCIADEIPFEIPDSWEWARLSTIVNYNMGKTPPRKEVEYWSPEEYSWISIADMSADGFIISTKEKVSAYAAHQTFRNKISPAGTLIMSFKLTVGKVSILKIDAFHNEAIISIFPYCDEDKIITNYLFKTLPLLSQLGATKNAVMGNTLNSNSLDNLLIPLPPLAEQRRIVAMIQQLHPYVYDYTHKEELLKQLNETLPALLKKSILQEAIQGKLVPQDPNDEPASFLLERIRKEKARLVKEGKLKPDKHESVIFRRDNSHYEKLDGKERCIDEEIPFKIPENWAWARLGNIQEIKNGDRGKNYPSKEKLQHTGIPFVSAINMNEGIIDKTNLLYLSQEQFNRLNAGKYEQNDILLCIRGSLGKYAIVTQGIGAIASSLVILHDTFYKKINKGYLEIFIRSGLFFSEMDKYDNGTAQPNLSAANLKLFFIPIPPIEEQERIVKSVESLFSFLNYD